MSIAVSSTHRLAHLRPRLSALYMLRAVIAAVAALLALNVGAGYPHLCTAGAPAIELFALFGVPLICLALTLGIKHLWLGSLLAAALILTSKLLCQPYLDLIHGPNNPWPAAM